MLKEIVIGSGSGMGKTMAMVDLAVMESLRNPNIVIFSNEIQATHMETRVDNALGKIGKNLSNSGIWILDRNMKFSENDTMFKHLTNKDIILFIDEPDVFGSTDELEALKNTAVKIYKTQQLARASVMLELTPSALELNKVH